MPSGSATESRVWPLQPSGNLPECCGRSVRVPCRSWAFGRSNSSRAWPTNTASPGRVAPGPRPSARPAPERPRKASVSEGATVPAGGAARPPVRKDPQTPRGGPARREPRGGRPGGEIVSPGASLQRGRGSARPRPRGCDGSRGAAAQRISRPVRPPAHAELLGHLVARLALERFGNFSRSALLLARSFRGASLGLPFPGLRALQLLQGLAQRHLRFSQVPEFSVAAAAGSPSSRAPRRARSAADRPSSTAARASRLAPAFSGWASPVQPGVQPLPADTADTGFSRIFCAPPEASHP